MAVQTKIDKWLIDKWLGDFVETERLPQSYAALARDHFLPLADQLKQSFQGDTTIIGVNGAQGTGKTTFAKLLCAYWTKFCDLRGTQISLDDFYLTKAERAQRAKDIHQLFATRGVPGTHDVDLAQFTLTGLKALKAGERLAIPSFDKAIDDRRPKSDWPTTQGAQDFIIFEGWCVGSRPVSEAALTQPINALEQAQDKDGIWRKASNAYLGQDYQILFALVDKLIFLKAPDFETILGWRAEQEEKLAQTAGANKSHVMPRQEIENFIQYFERVTGENLRVLPESANYVFEFDRAHGIVDTCFKSDD